MSVLVLGASGATGRLLVQQLLDSGQQVKAIVRNKNSLQDTTLNHENLTVIEASVLELTEQQLLQHVKGIDGIASCLGHNLSFKGMYGQPRRLVLQAIQRCCEAIETLKPSAKVKVVLMNTTGNQNRDLTEPLSFKHKLVVFLLRHLLPPHVDNEQAADYLRTQVGQNHPFIEWAAVRPDGLVDKDRASEYSVHESPIRCAIFDAGQTSRINVAHFMKELLINETPWQTWQGKMPVIYNAV